ncbi:MAG: alkaline phosphatase family protein [Rhodocyclaceae bacterium]|nr:alkaline phosphatase family protein [Rhodocyclaceae bacterium]
MTPCQPAYGGGSILDWVRWARARVQLDQADDAGRLLLGAPGGDNRRLVLALLDGLGDHYLLREGDGSFMGSCRQGALSSVFPSTTAAAVTTVMTGLSPTEHGLNGWVSRGHGSTGLFEPLPMIYHDTRKPLRHPLRRRRLFPYRTVFEDLGCPAFVISPAWLAESDFSLRHSRGAVIAGYRTPEEIPELVAYALERLGPRGIVYLYLPHFDAVAHDAGMGSEALRTTFHRLDACLARIDAACRAGHALLTATADHGLVDAPEAEMICLGAHADLIECLEMPLWGERRAAFVRCREGMLEAFQQRFEAHFPDAADWLDAAEILSRGLMGPGRPHRDIGWRLGDGVLLPRGRRTIVDAPDPGAVHRHLAVHGGLSAEEMQVPLLLGGIA